MQRVPLVAPGVRTAARVTDSIAEAPAEWAAGRDETAPYVAVGKPAEVAVCAVVAAAVAVGKQTKYAADAAVASVVLALTVAVAVVEAALT